MKFNLPALKKPAYLLQFALIAIWITNLADTDAFFITYALCAAAAVACLLDNYNHGWKLDRAGRVLTAVLSVLFGAAVVLANYSLFEIVRDPGAVSAGTNKLLNLMNAMLTLSGGCVAAWNVLCWLFTRVPVCGKNCTGTPRNHPMRVFWGTFAVITVINMIYHFFVVYPGSLTLDSIDQVSQIRDGIYSNHHPFWHSMVIKLFLEIGYGIFGDVNKAVSFYFIGQTLMMAACFAYVMMTLYQLNIPRLWMAAAFAVYAFMPYNIVYSSMMWKDVLFGGAVCVFLTAMLRILKGIGRKQLWNYILFALSGVGFCVWRSNGFLAILAAFFVFLLVLWKDQKKLLLVLLAVIVTGWVMKGPVLSAWNVAEPDLVESLSIPVQQVARVIADGCPLTEEEQELLDKVVDLEEVPELYRSDVSDNIKNEVRSKNNPYFEENIGQYLELWLKLLVRYPGEYIKAWVDQTRGYWGGGFPNWIFGEFINENDMGIASVPQSNIFYKLYKLWFGLVRNMNVFQPLHSIGLHAWLLTIFCGISLVKKRREWLLAVPLLMILLTLMVATPVYAEFRYAYAVFTSFPLVTCVSLYGGNKQKE